jgi:hypothetical protein
MTKILFVLALAACGKSHTDQCSKVIEGYNALGEAMRAGFGDGTDPDKIDAQAAAIDKATTALKGIELADAKVKAVRDDLGTIVTTHAANLKTMAGLVRDAKDPAKADAAAKKVTAIVAEFEAEQPKLVAAKQAMMTECNATSK